MTKRELSQLYYLNGEIKREQERLECLRSAATAITSKISGMPHSGVSNKTAIAAEIADCENLIRAKVEASISEYNRLIRYIATIDDSFMRQILVMRYIEGRSWIQVAHRIGGGNTADSVRKAHERFLQKQ